MPELILKFNLPDESDAADITVNADGMHNAIWNFKQELRSKLKHGSYKGKEYDLLEEINELFIKELDDNNVLKLFQYENSLYSRDDNHLVFWYIRFKNMKKKSEKNKIINILKVKEWLNWFKFRPKKPDYDGFKHHIEMWHKDGMLYEKKDLLRISKAYGLRIRDIKIENSTIFIEPELAVQHIELNIQILPSGTKFLD